MKIKTITLGAAIAAMYAALTLLSNAAGLASGVVQIRLSEALTVLPLFTAAAVPGLAIGCLIGNIIAGCMTLDVIFGSLATLIGACGTFIVGRLVKKKDARAYIGAACPIAANSIIVPIILAKVYGLTNATWILVTSVLAGEIVSAGILGILLYKLVKRTKIFEQKDE